MSIDELNRIREAYKLNFVQQPVRPIITDLYALITEVERLRKALGDCEAWARNQSVYSEGVDHCPKFLRNIIETCERTLNEKADVSQ